MNLDQFFKKSELIPAIVQDAESREVLMLAYMNRQALEQTLQTKKSTFYSRSRQSLWVKGETSGNFQFVQQALYDCDEDTILLLVKPAGPACHTGSRTCFYRSFCMEEEK
ncbi:phosphoribosyl-AMP cyclohydrolase [Christensenellaceae bacterium 44-20]